MPLEVPNVEAAELRELELQVEYGESREVTKTRAANTARVRAALQVVEINQQKAVSSKAGLFDNAIEQAFTPEGITADLTQAAALDAGIAIYTKAADRLRAVHLADAMVDHAAAAEREAEALLALEKSRRHLQEEK